MTDELEHAPDATTDALPFPEVTTPAANPEDVAAEFIAAAEVAAGEVGIKVTQRGKRTRSGVAPETTTPAITVPQWTPDGVGTVVVWGANLGFVAGDMATLEPEEETKVKNVAAMYANLRWPKGAKYEPEAAIIALCAEILGPRLMARYAQARAAAQATTGLERGA